MVHETGAVTRIQVSTFIRASRAEVWAAVKDIGSHVGWMADARAIRFTSPHRSGVGTTFECDTKVGPLQLIDRMEITEWRKSRSMGIRHVGLVTGLGRFTLKRRPGGTLFVWHEQLRFPWWMGGRLGAALASPVMRRIWEGNLARLKATIERQPQEPPGQS